MPGQQQKMKSNPASKRMGNAKLKVRRANSWLKNQKAKDVRKNTEAERFVYNLRIGCTGKMRYSNLLHSSACSKDSHVSKEQLEEKEQLAAK